MPSISILGFKINIVIPKFQLPQIIPRIKLPTLPLSLAALKTYISKISLPSFSDIAGKLSKIGASLTAALTPLQQQLSTLANNVVTKAPGNIVGFIGNTLQNSINGFTNIATGLIQNAVNNAVGAINSAVTVVGKVLNLPATVSSTVTSQLSRVSSFFSNQSKGVNSLVQQELNLISGHVSSILKVSSITATVQANMAKQINAVISSNNQIKKLAENNTQTQQLASTVAQNAINASVPSIASMLGSNIDSNLVVNQIKQSPVPNVLVIDTITYYYSA